MIKSKRLQAILSLINSDDSIIDVGCDHAYIAIESAKKGCKRILATDISSGAIAIANQNIIKYELENIIQTKKCDGLQGIDLSKYNTVIISGMGRITIQGILSNVSLPTIKKIIVQSNNELEELRRFMCDLGYAIQNELVVYEKKHYYTIIEYKKTARKQELKEEEYLYGIYHKENRKYYQHLMEKLDFVEKQLPDTHTQEKEKIQKQKELLRQYLMEEDRMI